MNHRAAVFLFAFLLAAAAIAAPDGEKFAVLKAGAESYTNVVVLEKTATHLVIQHAGGNAMVKLRDLDPALQKQFGFDPAKAAEIGKSNQAYVPPADTVTRDYPVSAGGNLQLTFPNRWRDSITPSADAISNSITVRFEREANGDFLALVSTFPRNVRVKDLSIRDTLVANAQRYLPNAEEPATRLMEFTGAETVGGYYSITNKEGAAAAATGNFKYQTQGLVKIGETAFSFTIFSNLPNSGDQKAALEMARSARYTGGKPGPASVPGAMPK